MRKCQGYYKSVHFDCRSSTHNDLQAYVNFTTLHCYNIVYLQHGGDSRMTSLSPHVFIIWLVDL